MEAIKLEEKPKLLIDLGCGPSKQKDHIGLDQYQFDGVDHILDIGKDRWPFDDGTVEGAYSSHFVEHLTALERCHFVNELHRVLPSKGQCKIITPHWSSCRAYGDPTHQWPPVSDFWFYYLDRKWRSENAPHTDAERWPPGYACDFEVTWGYAGHPMLSTRSQEFQQFAFQFYRDAIFDVHAT